MLSRTEVMVTQLKVDVPTVTMTQLVKVVPAGMSCSSHLLCLSFSDCLLLVYQFKVFFDQLCFMKHIIRAWKNIYTPVVALHVLVGVFVSCDL